MSSGEALYALSTKELRSPENEENCGEAESKMVRDRGFEPLTPSVSRKCSTTELTAHERLNKLAERSVRCKFVSHAPRKQAHYRYFANYDQSTGPFPLAPSSVKSTLEDGPALFLSRNDAVE